jgi:hypothetical protein
MLLLLLCLLWQGVEVVLHEAAGQQVQLRAYLHALQLATALHQVRRKLQGSMLWHSILAAHIKGSRK